MVASTIESPPNARCVPINAAALRLEWAWDRLASKDQEVLRLVTWDELSNEEAAQVLGCSTNALAIRLHRARQHLARYLEQTKTEGADACAEQKDPR